jgi:hypothetical protein
MVGGCPEADLPMIILSRNVDLKGRGQDLAKLFTVAQW